MTVDELREVLRLHLLWLKGEGGARANLRGANLGGANLYRANLREADLSYAYLRETDMRGADLSKADLSGANLYRADLRWANLSEANLYRDNLSGADLSYANLSGADLSYAKLSGADLLGAAGITPLPVSDPRGYVWASNVRKGTRYIYAGCHAFTMPQARTHWLSPDYDGPREVKETVGPALDWLEQQPLPEMN